MYDWDIINPTTSFPYPSSPFPPVDTLYSNMSPAEKKYATMNMNVQALDTGTVSQGDNGEDVVMYGGKRVL